MYIKRLADLIFGTQIRTSSGNMKNTLDGLEPKRLKSFISKRHTQIYKSVDFLNLIKNNFHFSSRFEAV